MDETRDFAHFVNAYHGDMLGHGYALQEASRREAWYFRSVREGVHETVTFDAVGIFYRVLRCQLNSSGDILGKKEVFLRAGGPYDAMPFLEKVR